MIILKKTLNKAHTFSASFISFLIDFSKNYQLVAADAKITIGIELYSL